MTTVFAVGDAVVIPWGVDEVHGTVAEVYGPPARLQVVVELRPEQSGYVVDEPTTVVFPVAEVRRAPVAA